MPAPIELRTAIADAIYNAIATSACSVCEGCAGNAADAILSLLPYPDPELTRLRRVVDALVAKWGDIYHQMSNRDLGGVGEKIGNVYLDCARQLEAALDATPIGDRLYSPPGERGTAMRAMRQLSRDMKKAGI